MTGKIVKKRISPSTSRMLIKAADGIFSVVSLAFSLRLIMIADNMDEICTYALIAYLFIAASKILLGVTSLKKDRLTAVVNLCYAAVLIAAGLIVYFASDKMTGFSVYILSFCAILVSGRVLAVVKNHRLKNLVFNILLILGILYYSGGVLFASIEQFSQILTLHVLVAFIYVLLHIISISFSQMRLDVLRKIIRKTFAAEILFGLALLIVSFSFVFRAMEPGIETFSDALWYSFAVVTTIGFGDFTVVAGISRILSVILGVYGIIVVALVTSIIVNFYNEVKDTPDDDESPDADAPQKDESAPEPDPKQSE